MKKLICVLLACVLIFSLVGCAVKTTTLAVNVEGSEKLTNNVLGKDALIEIGNGLWYDSTTGIVYWWNGVFRYNNATTPTPYYAPNGLPYRYNPHTNTFEEIER